MSYITNSINNDVVELLKSGGVGLLPSDTIYGLSCAALNEKAVKKLHRIKDRDSSKSFIILISDISQLVTLGVLENSAQRASSYWPGAVTAVLPAYKSPEWLTKNNTLAVRLPNSRALVSLIAQTGPIISTSANISGEKPIISATSALKIFGNKLDFYVNVGEIQGPPSTIIRITNSGVEILRDGAVKIKQ